VREFHEALAVPAPAIPAVPDAERIRLRMRLVTEECIEMLEAVYGTSSLAVCDMRGFMRTLIETMPPRVDLVSLADALADLDYVVEGTRQEFGIDGGPIADEVHASNMTKVGAPKDASGKVTKGPGYRPPSIGECLVQQGWCARRPSSIPPPPSTRTP